MQLKSTPAIRSLIVYSAITLEKGFKAQMIHDSNSPMYSRQSQSGDLLKTRSAPLTVSHHSPGGFQSAYGCCCLMASGANEFVRWGKMKEKKKTERKEKMGRGV